MIVTIIVLLLFVVVPLARQFGVNIAAPVLEFTLGIDRYHLSTPVPPRLELGERLRCRNFKATDRLTDYKIWASLTDLKKLRAPLEEMRNAEGRRLRDLVKVEARIHEQGQAAEILTKARIRKRGFTQPPSGPFPIKATFLGRDVSKFESAHFLNFGPWANKDPRWYPLYMYIAHELGLITPASRLVTLSVDSKYWGVYWQFEPWGRKTLTDNGISKGEIYGEDDEVLLNAHHVRQWENLDRWKKYDTSDSKAVSSEGREVEAKNFYQLDRLLTFLSAASQTEFNEKIFDYLDFDAAVSWGAHIGIMKNFSNSEFGGAPRLVYNGDTEKFQLIPWDQLPWTELTDPNQYPKVNILMDRLFNNPRFLRAYYAKLYQTTTSLLENLDQIFRKLYLSMDIRCAMIDNPQFVPYKKFSARELFTSIGGLKRFVWEPRWPESVEAMREFFASGLRNQLTLFENAQTSVYLNDEVNLSRDGAAREISIELHYLGLVSAEIKRISVPLKGDVDSESKVDGDITWSRIPEFRVYKTADRRNRDASQNRHFHSIGAKHDGSILFDNMDLLMAPDFPDWNGSASPKVLSTKYTLVIRVPGKYSIDPGKIKLEIVGADRKPVSTNYRLNKKP